MRNDASDTVEHADDRALRSEAGTECQLQSRASGEVEGKEEEHFPITRCLAFYDIQNTGSLAYSVQRQMRDGRCWLEKPRGKGCGRHEAHLAEAMCISEVFYRNDLQNPRS